LVVLKHSCRINLTKLDILDRLPEINVGIKYVVEGKELAAFPKRRL
jgi:adenylosuccinate synthase